MNSDSAVDFYNPVAHDDQDILLRDAARDPVVRSAERKRWIRIGVITLGAILFLGIVGGIVGGVVGARTVAPIVPPTSPTTARPTTQPTTTQPSTTTQATTTTTPSTTTQPTTLSTSTQPPTTKPTTSEPGPYPPTSHPMPKDPLDYPPVSLLIDTGMNPKFAEVGCKFLTPPVFKFNVTIADHTFTSPGANKRQLAKDAVAMVANEAIFGLKYPSIPSPKSKCIVVPLILENNFSTE